MTLPQDCYVISASPAVAEQIEKAKKFGLQFKIEWMPFDEPRPAYSEAPGAAQPVLIWRSTMTEGWGTLT